MTSFISDIALNILGYGCVSAAGVGSEALYKACLNNDSLPQEISERTVGDTIIQTTVRPVDLKALRTKMPKHPRFRRASSVSKFALTAVHDALGEERITQIQNREIRIGIVLLFMNGCVTYSNRFYSEVLDDPRLASPLIFPETVYNSPAGHLASYLNTDGPVYTMVSDSSGWFSAINVANGWLDSGSVDGCLVITGEELDWIVAESYQLYDRTIISTEGAAAIYFEKSDTLKEGGVMLNQFYGPLDYFSTEGRKNVINSLGNQISDGGNDVLIDGLIGVDQFDRQEKEAFMKWKGERISPNNFLGYSCGLVGGFQTMIALEALKNGKSNAWVMAAGINQHSFMAQFSKA